MTKLPIPFSNPYTYPGHSGVDYPQPHGTPFRASAPGVVTWLGHNAAGGFFIWVKYDGVAPKVGYHHMPSHAGCPREGARFKAGDRLGYVGNTGNSTGPHLHSEVEGHRTTAGYWRFFDRNRVVGSDSGGNTSGGSNNNHDRTPTQPTLEDLMALKNVTIATEVGKNQFNSTTLDFEDGMKAHLNKTNEQYTATVAKYLTGQSLLKITKGHYDQLLAEFDAHFKAKREHELAVARAQAGK